MILFCHEFIHLIVLLDVSESDLFLIFLKVCNSAQAQCMDFVLKFEMKNYLSFYVYHNMCCYVYTYKCKKWYRTLNKSESFRSDALPLFGLGINQDKHIL